jgi:hypothetical protein
LQFAVVFTAGEQQAMKFFGFLAVGELTRERKQTVVEA